MAFPTAGVLDAFTGGLAAGSWTQTGAFNDTAAIASDSAGGAQSAAAAFGSSAWNVETFGPDCEVYATVKTKATSGETFALAARLDLIGSTPKGNCYIAELDAGSVQLYRSAAGVYTALGSAITQAYSSGDAFGMQIIGTRIGVWYKASGGSWTEIGSYDTSGDATQYSNAGYLAVEINSTATTAKIDDFGGGTYTSAPDPWAKTGMGVLGMV